MRVADPGWWMQWTPRVRRARARAVAGLAQWTVLACSLVSCASEKIAMLTAWWGFLGHRDRGNGSRWEKEENPER